MLIYLFIFSIQGKAPVKCPRGLLDKESSPKEAATDYSCGQKSGSHKHSDNFLKTYLNPETETINDERKPTEEAFMCEQDRKSSEYNMQEPPNRSVSGDESDESDIVEHDVSIFVFTVLFMVFLSLCICASNLLLLNFMIDFNVSCVWFFFPDIIFQKNLGGGISTDYGAR